MATLKLHIDTSKGLKFLSDGKLSVKTSSLVESRSNGLYVPSLKGANGKAGGSYTDNHTVYDQGGKPVLDLDKTCLIFSMITKSSISAIITECNWSVNRGYNETPYIMSAGDLFMFRPDKIANFRGGDDGNRYAYNNCVALFVVMRVKYASSTSRKITSLKLGCLWSSVSGWTKGSIYSA